MASVLPENNSYNIIASQFLIKYKKWLLGFIYGSSFILIFLSAYRFIEPSQYIDRDDGVITYSHVVHLLKYGYIGVSPSGERLEGFSNPLDFILYLFFYGCFNTDFHAYNFWKTLFCTFGIGMVFSFFFGDKGRLGYLLSFGAAVLLASNTRFMAWHGSGLENPWSNFLLLFAVWILYRAVVLLKFDYWGGIVLFLACLTRAEGLYYIFPLMGLSFVFLLVEHKKTYIKPFLKMSLPVFIGLFVLFLARYWYFGSLLPNTSLALGIDVKQNLASVLNLNQDYLNESGNIFLEMIRHNNFWFLVIALPLLYFVVQSKYIFWTLCAISIVVLLGLAHPFVFHSGRLDPVRYTLQLAPLMVFLPVWLLVHLPKKQKLIITSLFIVFFAILNFGFRSTYRHHDLCCSIKIFQNLDVVFSDLAKTNDLHRPLLANPDLGIISIQKKYNILDMAYLASPHSALLDVIKPVQADYVFELAAPDILELHEYWACNVWSKFLLDARIPTIYKSISTNPSNCNTNIIEGTFFRTAMLKNSKSSERIFYDQVKNLLVKPMDRKMNQSEKEVFLDLIETEIDRANLLTSKDIYAPAYLNRVLYHFWPEIKAGGMADIVLSKLQKFALKDLALLQLSSATNKHWAKQTAQEVLRLFLIKYLNIAHDSDLKSILDNPLSNNPYLVGSDADFTTIYLSDKHVIYIMDAEKINKSHRFYLHIAPKKESEIGSSQTLNPDYFDNLDFDMPANAGFKMYNKLVYVVALPQGYHVGKFETGQYQEQTRFWGMKKDF